MEQQRIYNAALYCRLSKDGDGKMGIQTQRDILEGYCRQQGFSSMIFMWTTGTPV